MLPTNFGHTISRMGDVFDGYRRGPAWDEMIDETGSARPPYRVLFDSIRNAGTHELRSGADALARSYLNQGVTFDVGGEERPFPLDIVPRVIDDATWQIIETGVRQRVKTLEAFLADVYGPARAVEDGVIPRRVITSSKHFRRQVYGIEPPNGVRVHIAGIDLIRDESGTFRVLEDNVRVPSGVSYVLANRSALRPQWAEILGRLRLRPVSHYPQRLLAALRRAAPAGVSDPCVVVLTPGVFNGAYFEHAWLARAMGVELVEGRDLICSGGTVRMRDTRGERRVDVIYRRVDDEFLDPVQFRHDSVLGCPGLFDRRPSRQCLDRERRGEWRGGRQARSIPTCRIWCATTSARNPYCPMCRPGASRNRASCGKSWTGCRSWSSSRSTVRAARDS